VRDGAADQGLGLGHWREFYDAVLFKSTRGEVLKVEKGKKKMGGACNGA
jgi:hypothetical protein